jgi:hypothetical protein
MIDEKGGASSTPEEFNAASDAALASDPAEYMRLENERELAEATGKPLPEVSAPSKKENSEKPASETGTEKEIQETKPGPKESQRIKELLTKRVEQENEIARLRAELNKGNTPEGKPGEKKADSPPPPEKKADAGSPTKPSLKDFSTFDEYEVANDKYITELAEFKAKAAVAAARAEQEKAAADKAAADAWAKQRAEAEEEHADLAEVAFSKDTPITDVMDGFIRDSEIGVRILYALGQNGSAEGKRIAALPVFKQARALIALEASIAGSRGTSQPEKKTAPVKKYTAAPPPATDLGAKDTESADPELAALKRGDTAEYIRLANAREAKAARR